MKIVKNRARCRVCHKIVESLSKEDAMVYCSCGAIAVYGGKEALMRLGQHRNIEDLSIKVFDSERPFHNPVLEIHSQA